MKNTFRIFATLALCLGISVANAQSITVSPTGSVRIGADNDGVGQGGGQGRQNAPGQMKKQYGGSATDYAPGQQKKDGGVINFGGSEKGDKGDWGDKGNKGNRGGKGSKGRPH